MDQNHQLADLSRCVENSEGTKQLDRNFLPMYTSAPPPQSQIIFRKPIVTEMRSHWSTQFATNANSTGVVHWFCSMNHLTHLRRNTVAQFHRLKFALCPVWKKDSQKDKQTSTTQLNPTDRFSAVYPDAARGRFVFSSSSPSTAPPGEWNTNLATDDLLLKCT